MNARRAARTAASASGASPAGNLRERFPVAGSIDVERFAARRFAPLAADQHSGRLREKRLHGGSGAGAFIALKVWVVIEFGIAAGLGRWPRKTDALPHAQSLR